LDGGPRLTYRFIRKRRPDSASKIFKDQRGPPPRRSSSDFFTRRAGTYFFFPLISGIRHLDNLLRATPPRHATDYRPYLKLIHAPPRPATIFHRASRPKIPAPRHAAPLLRACMCACAAPAACVIDTMYQLIYTSAQTQAWRIKFSYKYIRDQYWRLKG
jgi:hypothetical protein